MKSVFGISLPSSWNVVPLKHVTSLIDRGLAPSYVSQSSVRAVSQAANQWSGLDWTKTRFHDFDGDPRHLRGFLLPRDILLNSTGTGTLGRVGFFDQGPDGVPCVADGHVTVVRTLEESLDARFAYYWLSSRPFQDLTYATLVVGATNQIELTDDTRDSPAIKILKRLQAKGAIVSAYDPAIHADVEGIPVAADPYGACAGAEVLVVLTEWDEFKWLDLDKVAAEMATSRVVDARNLLDRTRLRQHGFEYQGIGRS